MRNSPSELTKILFPQNTSDRTTRNVMATILVLSSGVFALMNKSNKQPVAANTSVPAATAPDEVEKPVSALEVENAPAEMPEEDIQGAPENGPMTIQQLPEGHIPHGTQIAILDEEVGTTYKLVVSADGTVLMIDDEPFDQVAIASKKTGFVSIPLGEYPFLWEGVTKKIVEGNAMLEIQGAQQKKEGDDTPEVKEKPTLSGEKDLAKMCRGAKQNGTYDFALTPKNITGIGLVNLLGRVKKMGK